nr:uncharacterized mitochondrial protein AtMg00810-like [Tanacetum cinerariifolium]
MGELTFFLGLQVKQKSDGIFISQDKYVDEILRKFKYANVKPASTPMDKEKVLLKDSDGDDVDVHLYRSMIRSLMYLTSSRPDIMFAGQPKLGLWYPKDSSFDLVSYTDSDYARASLDRKSTSGGCQFLGCRLISWQCKKQTMVSTSTTEAEYVAAASCCGQFWHTASARTLDNGEIELNVTVDGQDMTITEASVKRHLKLADADGISTLPTTKFFEQLTLIGIPQSNISSSIADEAITKEMHDGLGRATTTTFSLEAEQGSGNIYKTQTKATPSGPSSLRTSSEGGPECHVTMGVVLFRLGLKGYLTCPMNHHSKKVTALENELKSTKAINNKALITLTKRVKKLEKNLKHKRRRAVVNSPEDEKATEEIESLSIEDMSRLLTEFIDQRKKMLAAKRAKEKRNKPPTQAQQRTYMSNYIKNMGVYTLKQLKQYSCEEIKMLFDKTIESIKKFVPIESEGQIAYSKAGKGSSKEEQGIHVEALQTMYLIIVWEIYTEGTRQYWKIIRVGNITEERFSSSNPTEDKEIALWVELKRLFKLDEDDELWKFKSFELIWRLYDWCGVHRISTKDGHDIFMLVENEYPLSSEALLMMLVQKLQVDKHNEMVEELIRKIFMQAKRHRKEITSLGDDCWELNVYILSTVKTEVTTANTILVLLKVIQEMDKYVSTVSVKLKNHHSLGSTSGIKTRLVSQGLTQEKGIDYDEVFPHVARIKAIRLFLAYASFMGFLVYQMEVKSAFLYGKIEEEYLLDNRCHRSKIDQTLFIKRQKEDIQLVQMYVDDIIFGSTKKELCTEFEKLMHNKFQMSLKGELTFFLGFQVKQKLDRIFISQDKYVDEILRKFKYVDVKLASTPMDKEKALLKDLDGDNVDVHLYRSPRYSSLNLSLASSLKVFLKAVHMGESKGVVISAFLVSRDLVDLEDYVFVIDTTLNAQT